MNIDWENITALDLYVLLSSFCTCKSKIEKVEIFPSEYGIKEMEQEKLNGPDAEIFNKSAKEATKVTKSNIKKGEEEEVIQNFDEIIVDEENQDSGLNQITLRKYELKKLKYYYAIVTCDSLKTASKIYNECDGMEVERTQSFLDIRFVPDSLTEFPYKAKDICDHVPNDYNPNFGANRALQHTKVKLTWDSNDKKREVMLNKAFTKEQFDRDEIRELLMSSDDDDNMDEFKDLFDSVKDSQTMNLLNKKRDRGPEIKEGETIELTFKTGFEGLNVPENTKITNKDKSIYKNYIETKKNKRREKKQEERMKKDEIRNKRKGIQPFKGDNLDNDNINNNKFIKPANKNELNLLVDNSLNNKAFKYNTNDSRFTAIKADSRYAIDPTNKNYKDNRK